MTNLKKKVLAVSLVISIIAILSMGTLAWFQDQDTVTNNFMIADSNDDADDIFSVDIYEEYDSDDDGTDERYDVGVTYGDGDVTPGAELQKEVYVENTGKYSQYVRIVATISDISVWLDVLGLDATQIGTNAADLADFFVVASDFDSKWYRNDADTNYDATNDTLTLVYYYNGVLAADGVVPFIEAVKIPDALEIDHIIDMDGSFDIAFVAEAIQSDSVLPVYGAVEYQNAIDSFAAV